MVGRYLISGRRIQIQATLLTQILRLGHDLLPNQPNTMQPSPNLPHVSAQTGSLLNSGLIPPRSIPTPQQHPQSIPARANGMGSMSFTKPNPPLQKGLASSQSSIGAQGGSGSAMTNFTSPMSTLGLEKTQFDTNFKAFLMKRGGNIDLQLPSVENRPLDLHALHIQVMQEGGFSKARFSFLYDVVVFSFPS